MLAGLAWSTPDGRQIFSQLDLGFGAERAGLVGRNGAGKSTLLRLIAGEAAPLAGTVTVQGRLGLLRQSVGADLGVTVGDVFGIADDLALLDRAARGEAGVEELAGADWTLESRVAAALARVGLDAGPDAPLSHLSGGQRTRARLAALVFGEPDFLLLDEPTNNLDRDGRRAVLDLLAGWHSGAIVVSHDRELLETMDAIVELTSLGATRHGGNWSAYRERRELDLAAAEHDLADAERRLGDVERRTQETAERKARKDSGGRRKAARGDMPRILIGGMKARAEATSGDQARLAERRRAQAVGDAAEARARIEVLQPFSVVLPSTRLHASKQVLAIDLLTAGYDRDRPIIADLSISITGPERIALTGPNGSGKTTLIAVIAGDLQPFSGAIRLGAGFALFDQEVSLLDRGLSILDNFKRINPGAGDNACRAALARFMFRADAALQTVATLSGGQLLRAGLACVLGGAIPPPLLILDEPTNHLDLDSIATIEAGLRAYDGALMIVSHDEAFLDAVKATRRIELGQKTE